MEPRIIVSGAGVYVILPDGKVHGKNAAPSGEWVITGAVQRNNFGHVIRRFSLDQILADPGAIPWKFKNGSQQTFLTDIDHGTRREWRSPGHLVY